MRIVAAEILLRLLMGVPPPLKSFLSWIIARREGCSFHTSFFFFKGGAVICRNTHFDIIGTLTRASPAQTSVAEQQPRGRLYPLTIDDDMERSSRPSLRCVELALVLRGAGGTFLH